MIRAFGPSEQFPGGFISTLSIEGTELIMAASIEAAFEFAVGTVHHDLAVSFSLGMEEDTVATPLATDADPGLTDFFVSILRGYSERTKKLPFGEGRDTVLTAGFVSTVRSLRQERILMGAAAGVLADMLVNRRIEAEGKGISDELNALLGENA